jgi:hypothetical protein
LTRERDARLGRREFAGVRNRARGDNRDAGFHGRGVEAGLGIELVEGPQADGGGHARAVAYPRAEVGAPMVVVELDIQVGALRNVVFCELVLG